MSGLTEDEREAIYRADDHHLCGCDADVIEQAFAEDCCCDGLLDTFAAVERIIDARTRAVEQERDKAKQMLDGWQKTALQLRDQHEHEFNRAEAAEQKLVALDRANGVLIEARDHAYQRLAELETAVLALADAWDDPDPERGDPDRADELRALVSDLTALDRIRQEAVEAALAPIEALADVTLDWYASDKPLISADQLRQALAAARDAAGRS